jgi:hypothetical protein
MRGQARGPGDAHLRQKFQRLILDHIGQRADEQKLARSVSGRTGTMAARQASSPWVKVVSMPEPE